MTTATKGSMRIVGGLPSPDLIGRIVASDPGVPGTALETYGLEKGESIRRQASRAWPYLQEMWQDFQARRRGDDGATGQATRKWLHTLLRELGFNRLDAAGKVEIDGKDFPVSHHFGPHVPVHMVGWGTELDKRTYKVTARAPHAMMQELLNRSPERLWAVLSNGQVLRLLRDSVTLTGQSFLEFDLQAIFDGNQFSDFTRLYLICHQSRFVPHSAGDPASCYLEQWRTLGAAQGERALEDLRKGVEAAIAELGTGFLAHPGNPQLRSRLRTSELAIDDLNRSLLRMVYRLLFWFVAEDRDVLLTQLPDDKTEAERVLAIRTRYTDYFSSDRLRKLALSRRGTHHSDLWESTWLILSGLGEERGIPELALPGLGGIFESRLPEGDRPLPLDEPLDGARITNRAFLAALRALAYKPSSTGGGLRPVDFGNLGAEELGSVYEGLLELKARYNADTQTYTLETLPGNERKGTGSYYTPTSLVDCLLDSTLDPLLDQACKAASPEGRIAALLNITVCDPACGSGHFLVAAARRIAKRVAAEETGEPEPPDPAIRTALRRVMGRCIYGVDINPMAVELAKVSLWMEALDPGKPLTFLDTNIRVGNALLGTTPALLAEGLPSRAFAALEGDDRKVVAALKKQNTTENSGQEDLLAPSELPISNATLARRTAGITTLLPESLEDQHIQQRRLAEELDRSAERQRQKLLADAWCVAFVQSKTEETRTTAITHTTLQLLGSNADFPNRVTIEKKINDLTRQYRFFNWHVEFPHLFRTGEGVREVDPQTGWAGGFACVLGNPPWEKIELKEEEFFASREPKIAHARNASARKKLIAELASSETETHQQHHAEYQTELRRVQGWGLLLKESGRYPKTGAGRLNTYAVFAETGRILLHPLGRAGMVLPTGIATDATTAPFFGDLVKTKSLVSICDFENEEKIFKAVNNRPRFCLLTIAGRSVEINRIELAFRARQVQQIHAKRFTLTPEDIARLNPNTLTCPVFDHPRHAGIVTGIYRRVPVLWRDSPRANHWGLSFMQGTFNMATDAHLFRPRAAEEETFEELLADGWKLAGNTLIRGSERLLPLYEAKMIHHFDSRFATYDGATEAQVNKGTLPRLTSEQHADPNALPLPRYWVAEQEVTNRLARRGWDKKWLLGWRDIARSTDERTLIADVIPLVAVGHKFPLALTAGPAHLLSANLSSFVLDYIARQKFAGASMTYFVIKQLPVLPREKYYSSVEWLDNRAPGQWIQERALELSYTAHDLATFAKEFDDGLPFVWDEERRFVMRAELDAAYFHLYGIERDDVNYILDSFRAFQNNDPERFARTKDLILDVYDAMDEAAQNGKAYETRLDPPPGRGPRHPPRGDN